MSENFKIIAALIMNHIEKDDLISRVFPGLLRNDVTRFVHYIVCLVYHVTTVKSNDDEVILDVEEKLDKNRNVLLVPGIITVQTLKSVIVQVG
jgi:hypothetical protein